MESKWQWNISDLGFWGSQYNFQLIARVLPPLGGFVGKFGPPLNMGSRFLITVLPTGLQTIQPIGAALSGHFPYGLAVEPDN